MSDKNWLTNNGQTVRKDSHSERIIYKWISFFLMSSIFHHPNQLHASVLFFQHKNQCQWFANFCIKIRSCIVSHKWYVTDIFIHTISNNSLTTNLSEIRFLQIMDWYKNFCSTTVHIAHGMLLQIERFSKPIQSKG